MTGPSFHDTADDSYDIDDSDRHREDILTGQTDLWDAVDAEMDYANPADTLAAERAYHPPHTGGYRESAHHCETCAHIVALMDLHGPFYGPQEGRRATQTAKRYLQAQNVGNGLPTPQEPLILVSDETRPVMAWENEQGGCSPW
jgi:hypothetical protein